MNINRDYLTTVNYAAVKNKKNEWIVLHYTGNWEDKAVNNAKYFQKVYRAASAHYFVDKTSVYQSVEDSCAAFAVGVNYGKNNLFAYCKNNNSISVEMCSSGGVIADETITNTVELVRDLMARYGIDADHVVRHYDVCSKACPGRYGWIASTGSEQVWLDFKRRISAPAEPEPVDDYTLIFDAGHYRAVWPDLASMDDWTAFLHFLGYGMDEGRQASFWFSPHYYRQRYDDLQKAFGDSWRSYFEHYMRHGYAEGRFPIELGPIYDYQYYRQHNPDLDAAFGSKHGSYLVHFLLYGMNEGRQASEEFNPKLYRSRNKDLQDAFGEDWKSYYRHYLEYGRDEGRKGT